MTIQLVQGESRDLDVTVNLSQLPADSPIKVTGLETEGYRLFFYVKWRIDDLDSEALITKSSPLSGVEIVSPTVARVAIAPSDTNAIALPVGRASVVLRYTVRVQNTAGTVVYKPVYAEDIELLNAV